MNSLKIGNYLSCLRKYYKITQTELADRLSVSRQAVSKWETGIAVPDIEIMVKLSEMYGITVNDIIHGDISKIEYKKEVRLPGSGNTFKKIFIIGCGRWGTFIAWYLDKLGHSVTLFGRESSSKMKKLMETGKNEYVTLSDNIALTTSYASCADADIILISVNAQNLNDVAKKLNEKNIKNKIIVLCMKGIEIDTGRRLSQVVTDNVDHSNRVAVWLGPGHVQEFLRGVPNCMVIDSLDGFVKNELIRSFSGDLIRFYFGTDLIGNEIGAAAKNVLGIAAGMLDGLGLGSLKGALMARGTREISKLISAMGGDGDSVYGLCHLGDYAATLFSEHSQNLAFGHSFVTGGNYEKLAEGYYTVKAMRNLGKSYGVELPITDAVYKILYEQKRPREMLTRLFDRSLKNEF